MKNKISKVLVCGFVYSFCAHFVLGAPWSPLVDEKEQKLMKKQITDVVSKLSQNQEEAEGEICSSESSDKSLDRLIGGKDVTIKYVVTYYGTARYAYPPDPEKTLNLWFQNVLKYRQTYPGFDDKFKDIIPLLERGLKMVNIEIYLQKFYDELSKSGFSEEQIEEQIKEKVKEADMFLYFTTYRKDPSKFPCSKSRRSLGCYFLDKPTGRELIFVYVPTGSKILTSLINPKRTLTHEFGHSLGFGDLYRGKKNANFSEGSGKKNGKKGSIMNKAKELTCDDADGMIAMIDRKLGIKRTFDSLCMDGSLYVDGVYVSKKEAKKEMSRIIAEQLKKR
ncbi:MAG: hypothetical protein LBG46_00905 [Elusimicrobiota bacterium]|jgi:hypothetical protein|nr:hypothetical protein [Elusimicrobiota bacterium]